MCTSGMCEWCECGMHVNMHHLILYDSIIHHFHFPNSFRQIFCDFGKDFVVVDNDGETPVSCMISAVTQVH